MWAISVAGRPSGCSFTMHTAAVYDRDPPSSTRHDSSHFSMSWYGTASYATSSAQPAALSHSAEIPTRLSTISTYSHPCRTPHTAAIGRSAAVQRAAYCLRARPAAPSYQKCHAAIAPATSLASTNLLSVAVPGFTLPLSSIGYLWLAVLCSVGAARGRSCAVCVCGGSVFA